MLQTKSIPKGKEPAISASTGNFKHNCSNMKMELRSGTKEKVGCFDKLSKLNLPPTELQKSDELNHLQQSSAIAITVTTMENGNKISQPSHSSSQLEQVYDSEQLPQNCNEDDWDDFFTPEVV